MIRIIDYINVLHIKTNLIHLTRSNHCNYHCNHTNALVGIGEKSLRDLALMYSISPIYFLTLLKLIKMICV